MTAAAGPNLGLVSGYLDGDDGWGSAMNANLRMLDGLLFFTTAVAPLNAPPGSPALGDRYIVGTTPTGAWSGHAHALAAYQENEFSASAWAFSAPKEGWRALVLDASAMVDPVWYLFRTGAWAVDAAGAGSSTLAGDTDVAITSPADGDVLTYNTGATKWENAAPSTASLSTAQSWTKAQRGTPVALTDASTVASNFDLGNNFSLTIGGNRTLGNPSNVVAGQAGQIVVTQDGTGSRTLAYGSDWKFAGGTPPVLSTAGGAIDILSYYVIDSTHIAVSTAKAFA